MRFQLGTLLFITLFAGAAFAAPATTESVCQAGKQIFEGLLKVGEPEENKDLLWFFGVRSQGYHEAFKGIQELEQMTEIDEVLDFNGQKNPNIKLAVADVRTLKPVLRDWIKDLEALLEFVKTIDESNFHEKKAEIERLTEKAYLAGFYGIEPLGDSPNAQQLNQIGPLITMTCGPQ